MVDIGNDLIDIVAMTSELGFLYLMDYFIFLSNQTAEIEYLNWIVYFKGTDVCGPEKSLVSSAVYIEPFGNNSKGFWKLYVQRNKMNISNRITNRYFVLLTYSDKNIKKDLRKMTKRKKTPKGIRF